MTPCSSIVSITASMSTFGSSGFHYGVDVPDTVNDFGQVDQFQQTTQCDGPFGEDSTYCATQIQ